MFAHFDPCLVKDQVELVKSIFYILKILMTTYYFIIVMNISFSMIENI